MFRAVRNTVRVVLLAGIGFAVTLFGLSAKSGSTIEATTETSSGTVTTTPQRESVAVACALPDQKSDENDEIFFLSCGGMY